ncbi:MAG: hypothetical protein EZS28_016134, partial [Streblomastix strix]
KLLSKVIVAYKGKKVQPSQGSRYQVSEEGRNNEKGETETHQSVQQRQTNESGLVVVVPENADVCRTDVAPSFTFLQPPQQGTVQMHYNPIYELPQQPIQNGSIEKDNLAQ